MFLWAKNLIRNIPSPSYKVLIKNFITPVQPILFKCCSDNYPNSFTFHFPSSLRGKIFSSTWISSQIPGKYLISLFLFQNLSPFFFARLPVRLFYIHRSYLLLPTPLVIPHLQILVLTTMLNWFLGRSHDYLCTKAKNCILFCFGPFPQTLGLAMYCMLPYPRL